MSYNETSSRPSTRRSSSSTPKSNRLPPLKKFLHFSPIVKIFDPVLGTRLVPLKLHEKPLKPHHKPERSWFWKVNRWLENNKDYLADYEVFTDCGNSSCSDVTKVDIATSKITNELSQTLKDNISIASESSSYSDAAKSPNVTDSSNSTGYFSHILEDGDVTESCYSEAASSINANDLSDHAIDNSHVESLKTTKIIDIDKFRCKNEAKHNFMLSITSANSSCQICESTSIKKVERKVENTLLLGCIVIHSLLIALMSPYCGLMTFIVLILISKYVTLLPDIFASNNDLESIRTSFNQSISITNPVLNYFSKDSTHCFSIIFFIKDLLSCLTSKLRLITLSVTLKVSNVILEYVIFKRDYPTMMDEKSKTCSNLKKDAKTSEDEISTHFIVTCGFIVTYAWALTMLSSVVGILFVITLTIAAIFIIAKFPFPECKKKIGSSKNLETVNNYIMSSTSSPSSAFSQQSQICSEDNQKPITFNETNNYANKDNKSEEIYKVSVGLVLGIFYLVMYYLENYNGSDKSL